MLRCAVRVGFLMLHLGVVRLGPPPPPPQAAPRDPRPDSGGSLRSFASEPLCVSLLLTETLAFFPAAGCPGVPP